MKKILLLIMGVVMGLALIAPSTVLAKDSAGNVVIVLDPGHSKTDGGAVNPKTGLTESEVVWEIADSLKTELESYEGIKVYLTRSENGEYLQTGWLSGRGYVTRDGIGGGKVDFFISLHMNSSTAADEPYVGGSYVYASVNPNHKEATTKLASMIAANLKNDIGIINKPNGASYKKSSYSDVLDYYTVMENASFWGVNPILVEHCFINKADEVLLVSDGGKHVNKEKIDKIAKAEADAIVEYFDLQKRVLKAKEDGSSSITLERTYSFILRGEKPLADEPEYKSSNEAVATVDADGRVTAVGAGSAVVSVKFKDGTSGACTVNVNEPQILKIAAQYQKYHMTTVTQLKAFDLNEGIRVKAIYSDGTVKEVKPTHINKGQWVQGINEVRVRYLDYVTSVRIFFYPQGWVQGTPVTEAGELPTGTADPWEETQTQKPTQEPTQEETTTANTDTKDKKDTQKEENNIFKVILIVIGVIIVLGAIILVLKYMSVRKRRRRRRRY